MIKYDNFTIVISSSSGTGKTTIINKILEWDKNIKLSVSATTRKPREGEIDGINYYFLEKSEFESEIKNDNFIEYATVFDNYYGTLKREIDNKFNNNNDIILDIDWQGTRNVSNQMSSKNLLRIFILPPSINELENRLRGRGTDSEEVIMKRMEKSKNEISHFNEYDFIVVNDDVDRVFEEIKAIIIAKRLENINQQSLEEFVKNL